MKHKLLLATLFFMLPIAAFSQLLQLKATIKDKHLQVTWNSISNCDGYHLYYAPQPFSSEKGISYVDVGNNNSFDYQLSTGDSYYIAVSAHIAGNNISLSKIVNVSVSAKNSIIPSPILSTSVVNQTAYLQWIAIKSINNYLLYYSEKPFSNTTGINYYKIEEETHFSKKLPQGSTYYVAVVATKGSNRSHLSNVEKIYIPITKSKHISTDNQDFYKKMQSVHPLNKPIFNQKWIDKQASNHYSIQIMSSTKKEALLSFIKNSSLTEDLAYRVSNKHGTIYYSILNGVYATKILAQKAALKLPKFVLLNKPWIRSFKQLQNSD